MLAAAPSCPRGPRARERLSSGAMRWLPNIAVEDENISLLNFSCTGQHAQQSRLSDAVGPNEPDQFGHEPALIDLNQRAGCYST